MKFLLMQIPTYQDIQAVRKQLSEASFTHWLHDDFLSPAWWLLLVTFILPYFLWWKLADKTRYFEIISYGLLCGCLAMTLDMIGVDSLKWGYPDKLFPTISPFYAADLVVIPVTCMLMYQLFTTWKSFVIAAVIWAFMLSYVVEPLFIKAGMLMLHNWNHTYSFFSFILFGAFTRLIMVSMQDGLNKYNNS